MHEEREAERSAAECSVTEPGFLNSFLERFLRILSRWCRPEWHFIALCGPEAGPISYFECSVGAEACQSSIFDRSGPEGGQKGIFEQSVGPEASTSSFSECPVGPEAGLCCIFERAVAAERGLSSTFEQSVAPKASPSSTLSELWAPSEA